MATTAAQVIADARVISQDEEAPYRLDDPAYLAWLNAGLAMLRIRRPDIFFNSWVWVPLASTSANIPIEDLYRQPLADYVAARANLIDDEEASNTLVQALVGSFGSFTSG